MSDIEYAIMEFEDYIRADGDEYISLSAAGAALAALREKAEREKNRRADSREMALKSGTCPMCEDCPDGCPIKTPQDSKNRRAEPENRPLTNADRIRGMSDDELEGFLLHAQISGQHHASDIDWEGDYPLAWLKQPAETGGEE